MPKTPQKPVDEITHEFQEVNELEAVKAAASEPIKIADDAPPKFEMVVSDDKPEGFQDPEPKTLEEAGRILAAKPETPPPSNYRDSVVLRKEKERERQQNKDFEAKLLGTLKERIKEQRAPEIRPPQPVNPHIKEQTRLEMEAGRKMVEHHDTLKTRGAIAPRKDEPWEGKSVPVFRPGNVDEYKATFKSPNQTKDKSSGAVNP